MYEKKIQGFYPDFFIPENTLIEVVGFEWKHHIERTVEKLEKFSNCGYDVIVYTYPNLVHYFEGLSVSIALNSKDLEKFLDL